MWNRLLPVFVALLAALVGAGCSDLSAEPESRTSQERPAAVVMVAGEAPNEPADTVLVRSLDGSIQHRVALPEPALVRARSTRSGRHALILSRIEGAEETSVLVLDTAAGILSPVDLPSGVWEPLPTTGSGTHAAVLADLRSGRLAVIDLAAATAGVLPGDGFRGNTAPQVTIGPTGRFGVLEAEGQTQLLDLDAARRTALTDRDGQPVVRFVRWVGDGQAFEAISRGPEGLALGTFTVPDGAPAQTVVAFGQPESVTPTAAGALTIHQGVLGRVSASGGVEIETGRGPFTLPLVAQVSRGRVLVFDGSGSGGRVLLVDVAAATVSELDLPSGLTAIRTVVDGGSVPWLLDTRQRLLYRVEPGATGVMSFGPVHEPLPAPDEFHPGAEGILVLERVGDAVLERAAAVYSPSGRTVVWRGRDAAVNVSEDGRMALLTGRSGEGASEVVVIDLSTGEATSLGRGFGAVWIPRPPAGA